MGIGEEIKAQGRRGERLRLVVFFALDVILI